MSDLKCSEWSRERFGDAAEEFLQAIPLAIQGAHEQAVAAHIASELSTNDAYGNTLKVAQYEQLIACTAHIPGVVTRKPADVRSRFELVVLDDTAVVLHPWRYAADGWSRREDAKLPKPLSDLRRSLLTLAPRVVDSQLSFDQIDADPEDLAEEEAVLEQLAQFGRVVTIGYASSPSGLFDLGIGDAELVNTETGAVVWHQWEPLSLTGGPIRQRPTVVPAPSAAVVSGGRRFDDAPLDEPVLAPRATGSLRAEGGETDSKTGSDGV
ncbi:hypothetical protein [Prescottella equi]